MQVQSFDERVSLLAPPLLFQSRAEAEPCDSTLTTPFLAAQWNLAQVLPHSEMITGRRRRSPVCTGI